MVNQISSRFVKIVDGFLSPFECEFSVAELDYAHWRTSHLISRDEGGREIAFVSPRRISNTANQDWFSDELTKFVVSITARLSTIADADPQCFEPWQATRYPLGGHLDHHLDAGYWGGHPWGERKKTFIIYLTTPTGGGSTYFRALDQDVAAVQGRLVWWENLFFDGRPNHRALHCAVPLEHGEKITLITWLREQPTGS